MSKTADGIMGEVLDAAAADHRDAERYRWLRERVFYISTVEVGAALVIRASYQKFDNDPHALSHIIDRFRLKDDHDH